MKTNTLFYMILLLSLNVFAWAVSHVGLDFLNVEWSPDVETFRWALQIVASAFVVIVAIFMYFAEKFRDKEQEKYEIEYKRHKRREYYRNRNARRKAQKGKLVTR